MVLSTKSCESLTILHLFFAEFCCKILAFLGFLHKKRWKWLFPPAFGVRSTQTLVKIYNIIAFMKLTPGHFMFIHDLKS